MGKPRFRQLPHTADFRLAVYGETEEELYRHLALGLAALVLGRIPRGKPLPGPSLVLPEEDLGSRLVRLGNEVLFWLFTRRQLTLDVRQREKGVDLFLYPLPRRAVFLFEVKAVTFHALYPRRHGSRLRAVLTLDV
jgi:SHS2 domain-containing protein